MVSFFNEENFPWSVEFGYDMPPKFTDWMMFFSLELLRKIVDSFELPRTF